jgi:hypothetical protein
MLLSLIPFKSTYHIRKTILTILFFHFIVSLNVSKAKENSLSSIEMINVFLDFSFHTEYIQENIAYVNYVRDRESAHVHIMMTRHESASAGTNFVITFIGRERFEGMNNKLIYWSPGTNTVDDTRKGFVGMLRMGLVPYLASTAMISQLTVTVNGDISIEREPVVDAWQSWVFEVYGGGNFYKESKQSRLDSRWGFSMDKISEDWKIRVRPFFNINRRKYITDEGTVINNSHRHGFNGYLIKSINQHWSRGFFLNMLSSTFHNMKYNIVGSPGIEYSLFPYSEASRKAITLVYRVGVGHHNYIEETVFLKERENLAQQALELSIRFQQPWGSFRTNVTASNYFHDFNLNRTDFYSQLNLRITKGLSLSLNGSFNFINDLVSLPAGELSLEDILLQRRRQATNYQFSGAVGLTYRFGSQFSNVVNTRF